jgi:hypothetical protein
MTRTPGFDVMELRGLLIYIMVVNRNSKPGEPFPVLWLEAYRQALDSEGLHHDSTLMMQGPMVSSVEPSIWP